ncbi:hypothetical protein K8I31_18815 [bacterium]|nr:hypothetical protein [bacterium]
MMKSAIECDFHVDLAENLPESIVQDYFQKRETWYQVRNHLMDYTAPSDHFDDSGYLILASNYQECVGGFRVTLSHRGNSLLPMEQLGMRIQDVFPEYDLSNKSYAEIGKLVIHSNHTSLLCTNTVLQELIRFALDVAKNKYDIHYLFVFGWKEQLRLYKMMARYYQFKTFEKRVNQRFIPGVYRTHGENRVQVTELKEHYYPFGNFNSSTVLMSER